MQIPRRPRREDSKKGKQMFNNSMYPFEQQSKYKDIIVIDDIVFTFPRKCDSSNQHKEMFSHYRVTCAIDLTYKLNNNYLQLNNIEKIIYARDRNASSKKFTSARSMLVRYW